MIWKFHKLYFPFCFFRIFFDSICLTSCVRCPITGFAIENTPFAVTMPAIELKPPSSPPPPHHHQKNNKQIKNADNWTKNNNPIYEPINKTTSTKPIRETVCSVFMGIEIMSSNDFIFIAWKSWMSTSHRIFYIQTRV